MTQPPDPDIWRPVEELAAEWGAPVSEIVSLVLDGDLEGRRFDYRWYVIRPLVTLHYPDPDDLGHAELRFRAFRLGNYLTAARGQVNIPIRQGDPGLSDAIAAAWAIDELKPPRTATFRLGAQDWIFDATLSRDLGRCLVCFAVEFEVGGVREGEDTCSSG